MQAWDFSHKIWIEELKLEMVYFLRKASPKDEHLFSLKGIFRCDYH